MGEAVLGIALVVAMIWGASWAVGKVIQFFTSEDLGLPLAGCGCLALGALGAALLVLFLLVRFVRFAWYA